jgi:hypothetical protein
LELFFNFEGLFAKVWTAGHFQRNRGASLQNSRNNRFPDLIFNEKFRGLSPRCGGPWTAPVHGGPRIEGEDEPVEAALGRCSLVTDEWQRGGAPEAPNGGGLNSSRGQRRARRSSGERGFGAVRTGGLIGLSEGPGGGGVTAALMALKPLKMDARLRGGLRGGGGE